MFDNCDKSFNESVSKKEVKLYHLSCSFSILAFPQWISSQYIHLLSDRTLDHYLSYDHMCYNYPSVIEFQEKKERKIENLRFVPREFLFSIIDCSCVDGLYNIARTKISNSLRIEKGARLLDSQLIWNFHQQITFLIEIYI